jgi:hypothetical protein
MSHVRVTMHPVSAPMRAWTRVCGFFAARFSDFSPVGWSGSTMRTLCLNMAAIFTEPRPALETETSLAYYYLANERARLCGMIPAWMAPSTPGRAARIR